MLKKAWTFPTREGLTSSSPTKRRFENKEVQKNAQASLDIFLHFFIYS